MMNPITTEPKPSDVLNVRRLPGRLNAEQAAALLGFAPHDIPVLVRAKLLKSLGKPQRNAVKWFASCEIEGLRQTRSWLDRATKAVREHWRIENVRNPTPLQESPEQRPHE